MKMHENEVEISDALVHSLLQKQFPELSKKTLKRIDSYGTDNVLYKLGDNLLVRLPKIDWAKEQIEKEFNLLPKIAHFLPLKIPKPLSIGLAQGQYPWDWGIYEWLEGSIIPIREAQNDLCFAEDLANFVLSLKSLDIRMLQFLKILRIY